MIGKRSESNHGMSHNLASQKEILRRLLERARNEGDEAAVEQLSDQLAQAGDHPRNVFSSTLTSSWCWSLTTCEV